jgi:hypothetical protein
MSDRKNKLANSYSIALYLMRVIEFRARVPIFINPASPADKFSHLKPFFGEAWLPLIFIK